MTPNKTKNEKQILREKFDFYYLLAYSVNGGYCPKNIDDETKMEEVHDQLVENCISINKMESKRKKHLSIRFKESKFYNYISNYFKSPTVKISSKVLFVVSTLTVTTLLALISPLVLCGGIIGCILAEIGIIVHNLMITKDLRHSLKKTNNRIPSFNRKRILQRVLDTGMELRQRELNQTPKLKSYRLIKRSIPSIPVIDDPQQGNSFATQKPQESIEPDPDKPQPVQPLSGGHQKVLFPNSKTNKEKDQEKS